MTLQIAFLIGKWSEENFCTGDCQRDSPLTKLLPTILAQPSLPRQRCYNVGNKKHTLQHYFVLYTYPHVYTLTHSKEWGSTSYSTQPKPGHQFWSFIRTQSRAFVCVVSGHCCRTPVAELNNCKRSNVWQSLKYIINCSFRNKFAEPCSTYSKGP